MNTDLRLWKGSDDEVAFGRRVRRHAQIGLIAFFIPYLLSAIILANGSALSAAIAVDENSFLFRLWPFNRIYLRPFVSSPYSSSEIKWFFTVVSISNLIWLIFIGWKFAFELFRKDVAIPPSETPVLYQAIVRVLVACSVMLGLFILVGLAGFNNDPYTFLFGLSFKQSITVGAIKVVMVMMFFSYVGAAFLLEFGGLGVRYLLSKKFGLFAVKNINSPEWEN
jgi:hypothetical protein